ncbi:MAG: PQQ-binding-like beta-propeller repeat protein [Acidobacteria bacterium]|nr:PQQ-binding-like beta-propeller repeat protein [Acidobacteriota bacterium]
MTSFVSRLKRGAGRWAVLLAVLGTHDATAQNWPSFRGLHAGGVADGQNLPALGSAEKGLNAKWKTSIPGLAHSSPVVWGDRLYVTTAVSSAGDDSFKAGLYGEGTASEDRSIHQWKVFALDKRTGKIVWEKVAYRGVPKEKRHIKATYANSTPATNGAYVVAFFGSQGLYAFTSDGTLAWKKDLGRLDVGAYDAPDYEWGPASSPIIFENKVIVQVDTQDEDYLLALDLGSGETVWKTDRDELPSWGTPTVCPGESRAELVTNGSRFIRGYDPTTGKERWRLGGSSQITAPTPICEEGVIVVVSGRRPEKPIFVIRPGAAGDITLAENQTSSADIVWSRQGRGSYMPTPLVYRGLLYVLQNQGILDCYELETGKEVYRRRLPHGGSGFSGSPVAADGVLYLPGEDGDVFAVKAGPRFELLSRMSLGEPLMTSPALSDGMLYLRAHHHVYAFGY